MNHKTFKLKPYQQRFITTPSAFPAMVAGWGTGKTASMIFRTVIRCMRYRKNLALIGRKHFTDLRDSTMKDFHDYTGIPINSDGDAKLGDGSIIMFRHAEQFSKLQNVNLGVAALEQAEEFDDQGQWDMLHGRMRRKDCGGPSLFLIANTAGNNWIKKLWKDRVTNVQKRWSDTAYVGECPFGYELIEAGTMDNIDNVDPTFKDKLESLKHTNPERHTQYVENSWDVLSGRIFQQWDPEYHVIPDMKFPQEWETIGGIDPAVSTGVFCALVAKVNPEGDIIIMGEYYDKEKVVSQHVDSVNGMIQRLNVEPLYWVADPAAFIKSQQNPKEGAFYSLADEMVDNGLAPRRGENAVNAGINHIAEYLMVDYNREHPFKRGVKGAPKLFVTESCKNLIKEIAMYREVPNKPTLRGDAKWTPFKKDDHSVDALRYLVMTKPIGTLMPVKQALPPRYSYNAIVEEERQHRLQEELWW